MTAFRVAVTRTTAPCCPTRAASSPGRSRPGEEIVPSGGSRAALLMDRILDLAEPEVASALADVMTDFAGRHRGVRADPGARASSGWRTTSPREPDLSRERRLLIGAYFTHEYSVEAAALFNPSMVLAPDQSGLPPGHCRFVMSLRAVGEGHTSSIEFRSGIIDSENEVTFDPLGPKLVEWASDRPASYDKQLFGAKLGELGASKRHRLERVLSRCRSASRPTIWSARSHCSSRTALPLPSATRPRRSSASSPRRTTSRPSPPTPSCPSG